MSPQIIALNNFQEEGPTLVADTAFLSRIALWDSIGGLRHLPHPGRNDGRAGENDGEKTTRQGGVKLFTAESLPFLAAITPEFVLRILLFIPLCVQGFLGLGSPLGDFGILGS